MNGLRALMGQPPRAQAPTMQPPVDKNRLATATDVISSEAEKAILEPSTLALIKYKDAVDAIKAADGIMAGMNAPQQNLSVAESTKMQAEEGIRGLAERLSPGIRNRGKQVQTAQARKMIGGMPRTRAQGGIIGLREGGDTDTAMPVGSGQPIPMLMQKYGSEKVMEFLKKEKELKDIEGNVAPERREEFEMMKANIESLFDPQMIRAIRRTRSGPDEVNMQAGGVIGFQNRGLVEEQTINPNTGLPYTTEEFKDYLDAVERRRNNTMVDASRLRDPNSLTPAQESERDLAIIRQAQEEQARRDQDKKSLSFEEIQQAYAGTPTTDTDPLTPEEVAAMNRRLAANVDPEIRDDLQIKALQAQYPFMDPEYGLADLIRDMRGKFEEFRDSDFATRIREGVEKRAEEREDRARDTREAAEISRRQAEELERLEAGLTAEQRARRFFSRDPKLVTPSTMTERGTKAGLQPEKTPMSDKIFSLLQTLGDFSGAPKGYEGATFLARRRAREEAETDRQAKADLLDRELEGRFELMKEQEKLRSMAARGVALADYAGSLTDFELSQTPEYTAKRDELLEEKGGGIFNILTDAEEIEIQNELRDFTNELKQRKVNEYRSLLDAFDGSAGLPAILPPAVQEYSEYRPSTE